MSDTPKDAKGIFLAALEIADAGAQADFLERSCGGDAALRQRVDALLHAYGEPGGPLDKLAAALAPTELGEPIREQVGTAIGAYKLMEQIGEGGFGLVFVAEQQQPIRRKVALKIIKPGMDSRDVIARFEAERQALALMDHPNIARVLDAGTTDSGRPYFVMELVHGIPITDYCDQNQLTPRERLELFVAVCNAVQHAHQKGIIHRDIKPSNVLVTLHDGLPVVKVIDFGVAKALHQKLTEHTIYTRFAQMIGTPLYMSPEQAEMSGLDIDTRSDVYSLGVLMYELLTGTTPFDKERLAKAAYNELIRIIREEEPPKPSTRLTQSTATLQTIASKRKTEPARLSRLFRGDLDWITMKALEKDRTRRYGSARELAEDIRRWDRGDPIVAQPPTLRYLLGKYVRRNRLRLGIAAAVLLALIGGTVFEFYRIDRDRRNALESRQQERDARAAAETALREGEKQRKIAEANFRKARQVVDRYFTLISEGPLKDIPGAESLRKELLSSALKSYQDFPKDESDDAEMQAELAASYFRMSQIEFLTQSADWLTESEKGLAILERLLAKKVPIETFKSFDAGIIDVSGLNLVLGSAGPDPRLVSVFERGVRAWDALVARQPSSPGFRSDLATMHYVLGNVKYGQAQLAKFNQSVNPTGIDGTSVEPLLREALASKTKARDLWQQLSNERPDQPRFRAALASAETDIGGLYLFQQKHSPALKAYLNSYGLNESLTRDFPEVPAYRRQLANVDSALTLFYVATGDVRKAADFMRRQSTVRAKMVADFPTVPAYKMSLEQTQRSNISLLCMFFSQIPARPKELLVVFDLYAEIVDEQINARRTAGSEGNLESGEDQSSLDSDPAFPTPTPYFGARALRNFGGSFRSMSAGAQEEMLGLLRKRANEIDARGAKTYRLAEFAALWWSGKRDVAVSRLEVDARQMPGDPQFQLMLARARSQLDRSPPARNAGTTQTLDQLFSAFTNPANGDESARKIAETIVRADPDAKLSSQSWLDVLDHRDALVRKRAIRALPEKMLQIEPCLAQLEQFLSDPDPGVRMAAATRLSAVSAKRERIVDLLVSWLQDPVRDTRLAALEVLGTIGPNARAASRRLQELLDDPVDDIRLAAWTSLWRIDHDAAPIKRLAGEFRKRDKFDRNDVGFRLKVIRVWVQTGPAASDALPALCDALAASLDAMRKCLNSDGYLESVPAAVILLHNEVLAAISKIDSEGRFAESSYPEIRAPAPDFRFRVVAADGKPVSGATVHVTRWSWQPLVTTQEFMFNAPVASKSDSAGFVSIAYPMGPAKSKARFFRELATWSLRPLQVSITHPDYSDWSGQISKDGKQIVELRARAKSSDR